MAKILSLWGTHFTTGLKNKINLFIHLSTYYLCVCGPVHVCTCVGVGCTHATACMLGSEDNFVESGLSSHRWGLRRVKLASRYFYLLRDLVSPYFVFKTGNFEARNAGLEVTRQLRMTLNALSSCLSLLSEAATNCWDLKARTLRSAWLQSKTLFQTN